MLTRPSQWDKTFYDSDDDYGYLSPGIFDGPPYYAPYGRIRVTLPRGSRHLASGHLLNILPGLSSRIRRNGVIDGIRLAEEISRRLKSRGVDFYRVSDGLPHVFRAVQESENGFNDFGCMIVSTLQGSLRKDSMGPSHSRGLAHSRSLFAIFANLAKITGSIALGSALSHFLDAYQSRIIPFENGRHIASWGLSFMDVAEMAQIVDHREATACFRALSERLPDIENALRWGQYYDQRLLHLVRILRNLYGDWSFPGRRPIRPLGPLLPDIPRPNTVPPGIIHRPPPLMLPSSMPISTYPPSPPIMDLAFRPPYMNPAVEEQVDNLSMEVDNIGRHQMGMQDGMEQLHDNQLALRDEQVHQENHLRDLGHHVGNVEHNQMTMVHHLGHVEQRQKDFERNQNHFNRDLYEKIEDLRDRITTSW